MILFKINFMSDCLSKHTDLQVLMPKDLHCEKPRILYLLHGMTHDHTSWLRNTNIEMYARLYKVCLVAPEADLSFYNNMAYGADYSEYIGVELPSFLERHLPVFCGSEADIAGISMGGYGAFYTALKYPQRYRTAVSLSGPMKIEWIYKILSDNEFVKMVENLGRPEAVRQYSELHCYPEALVDNLSGMCSKMMVRITEAIFGHNPDFKSIDIYNLIDELPKNELPELLAYCGEDDLHYQSNLDFAKYEKSKDIRYKLFTGKGNHNWQYWNNHIPEMMSELYGEKGRV